MQVNRTIDAQTRARREGSPVARPSSQGTTTNAPVAPRQTLPDIVREDDEEVSWGEALFHNGALGAAESMAGELWYALRSIPRLTYKNPFRRPKS